jgi:hypothetical protein
MKWRHLIRKPANGEAHQNQARAMYMGGAHQNLVWVAYAASATPSTLNTTGRNIIQEQERTGRGAAMEGCCVLWR